MTKASEAKDATSALTISEFLLARLSEDTQQVLDAATDDPFLPYGQHWSEVPFQAGAAMRILADADAKTAVVKKAAQWVDADRGFPHQTTLRLAGQDILSLLAVAYSEHPDYDEGWRP